MQLKAVAVPKLQVPIAARRCLIPLLVAASACSDASPTENQRPARGFTVVSGQSRTDTALAYSGALVVELRGENGEVQPGTDVVIRPLISGPVWTMYLDSATTLYDSLTRTTDDRGRFSITPRYGRLAGPAGIILTAPSLAVEDTLDFTVRPGAAYRVAIVPHDTAVRLNRDVTVSIAVRDRYGNTRPEVPTIQAGSGIRVAGNGRVTGVAYGRAPLVATFGTLKDSGSVTVVPPGRLAGIRGGSLFWAFVVNTDGSGFDPFVWRIGWPSGSVHWARDGAHVLLSSGFTWTGSFRLYEVAVTDHAERLVWSPPQGTQQGEPDYSPEGDWVYFVYVVGRWDNAEGGTGAIWRVRRDGSSPQEVIPAPGGGGGWLSPAPAPDGSALAYVGTDGSVVIRTLASGATRTIAGLAATSVQWSPNATRLVVAGRQGLFVMAADGSGRRQLRPAGIASGYDAAWSPDGNWVIWNSGGGIEIVRLDPELFITLPFSYSNDLGGGWGFSWANQP